MQLFWVVLLNIIANTGIGVLLPLMPVLLQQHGFTVSQLSIPFFAIVFGRIIAKFFCQKFFFLQYRFISVISFAIYTLIFICYIFFRSHYTFVGLRFLEGFVEGILVVMLTDIAIHISEKHNRGFYMGIFGFSFGFGMILGPLYGGILYAKYGVDAVFIANAVLGLIGILCSFKLEKYTIQKEKSLKISMAVIKLMAYYSPAILRRIYLFSFAIFLPIYIVQTQRLNITEVSRLFVIIAISLTILGPFSGRLVDIISARWVIIIGMVAMSICSFAVYLCFGFAFFYIMLFFFGMVLPAGMKFFADLVREHKNRTQILGFAGTVTEFATIFVALIVPIISAINIQYNWLFLAIVGMLSTIPFISKKKFTI
jgi:MFS family permease